mmetsp:Transcript_9283/g.10266  ORF Transcript_9283/g.10266 Transcript_9283/m.10266 type:complete len:398 (-) Transcript_9283:95-1288(-)
MSASSSPILMIPGPIEVDPQVLEALGRRPESHVSPVFIKIFSEVLINLRKVFCCKKGQPFVISASGTLGWDATVVNLFEQDSDALIISSGYFGDRFLNTFKSYNVNADIVQGPAGTFPSMEDIKKALSSKKYRGVTITHVDTSTGVLADVKSVAAVVKEVSPDTLIIVDGVCASAGEELRMDEWGIDYVMTASQKALGVPPGLSVSMASERAIATHGARVKKVPNYYADWQNWLPIMKAYESLKPSYFATPPVNLITALHVSLTQMLADGGMEANWSKHKKAAAAFKSAVKALGLGTVPVESSLEANTLSCVRFPEGINAGSLLPKIKAQGVILAGGLHKDIKAEYFRVGHMSISATRPALGHLTKTVEAIETALAECNYEFKKGAGIEAFANAMKC